MIERNFNETVEFKGTKRGMLIVIDGSEDFNTALEEMKFKLKRSGSFFSKAPVRVQVKNKELTSEEMDLIQNFFKQETELELTEIISGSGEVLISLPSSYTKELGKNEYDYRIDKSIVIRKTLRSGQKISFPGTIIVVGNVNPGSELVAEGDIIVYGALKGVCHAGSNGDKEAMIMSLCLMASQLRIADVITKAPEEDIKEPEFPEKAFISGDKIVVEAIDYKNMQRK
ncbi:septum site-determining protein MinC [Natranaerofaba carboxydovora]|uniref:septum site-determining protein MinC n=1 Tax=Natranaerofaba carboxydovora TaxID=2742683 RepID=UPI001F13633C|nr:septum site-determining protein MinC [Natranaerofaba carboxydovora]UMZ72872.1 putative septum site-determining protein MinC [Natranaerofaba carboxydovora]